MGKAQKLGIVAAMWVMGLAMLAFFGWLVHVRNSTPVEAASTAATAGVDGKQAPLAALARGAAASAQTAANSLADGTGGEAAHALEAAHRVSQVGMESSWGPTRGQFTIAEKQLITATESLHDGRTSDARTEVRAAATALEKATTLASGQHPDLPPEIVWGGYETRGPFGSHATGLLNANGSKIGQVERIEMQGGKPVAILQVGGLKSLFGVIDLGGTQVQVPADRLVYGARRSLGYVWVVAPTTATDAAGISAELGKGSA